VGRGIRSRFTLHGVLVGLVAALIYVGLTRAQPEPLAYVVAHGLKLLGGACGGFVAARRAACKLKAASYISMRSLDKSPDYK